MMCRKGGAQCQTHKRHLIDGGDAVTGSTRLLRVCIKGSALVCSISFAAAWVTLLVFLVNTLVCVCVCAGLVSQFATLCDPVDCSPASLHHTWDFLDKNPVEWVAISFSRGSA